MAPSSQPQRGSILQPRVDRRGDLPWVTPYPRHRNPERVASVPDEAFIVRNVVAFEQRAELVLKRRSAVMLFLIGDVAANSIDLRCADGEDPVAALPSEVDERLALGFEPGRRASFRFFDH